MSEKLYEIKMGFLRNADGTKFFLWHKFGDGTGIRIPITLGEAIIEKRSVPFPNNGEWIPDNLSTIEFQAKLRGLV